MAENNLFQELATLKAKQINTYAAAIKDRNDEPTAVERVIASNLLEELEYLDDQIQGIKRRRGPCDPGFLAGKGFGAEKQGYYFRSFGEQLQSIYRAAQPGEATDKRLHEVRAALGLSEAVPSDAGFLLEPSFSREIFKVAFTNAQIAPLCREIPIGGNSNSVKVNAIAESDRTTSRWGGIIGYFLAEASTKIPSAPKFRQMELTLKKFVILCYATDELLEDAALLDTTLRQGFSEELALRLDDSIIRGSGAGQPLGILNAPCLVSVARTTAGTISIQDIYNLWQRLLPGSHRSAIWLVNPDSLAALYQLSISIGTAGGNAVFMPNGSIQGVPYSTILGRPVVVSEVGSSIATAGALILADFSSYGLITKGTKTDVSMHLQFLTDQSVYRAVTRLDGMPLLNTAVVPFKGANSLSAFISLAA